MQGLPKSQGGPGRAARLTCRSPFAYDETVPA
jgi:hypothetical protein